MTTISGTPSLRGRVVRSPTSSSASSSASLRIETWRSSVAVVVRVELERADLARRGRAPGRRAAAGAAGERARASRREVAAQERRDVHPSTPAQPRLRRGVHGSPIASTRIARCVAVVVERERGGAPASRATGSGVRAAASGGSTSAAVGARALRDDQRRACVARRSARAAYQGPPPIRAARRRRGRATLADHRELDGSS